MLLALELEEFFAVHDGSFIKTSSIPTLRLCSGVRSYLLLPSHYYAGKLHNDGSNEQSSGEHSVRLAHSIGYSPSSRTKARPGPSTHNQRISGMGQDYITRDSRLVRQAIIHSIDDKFTLSITRHASTTNEKTLVCEAKKPFSYNEAERSKDLQNRRLRVILRT